MPTSHNLTKWYDVIWASPGDVKGSKCQKGIHLNRFKSNPASIHKWDDKALPFSPPMKASYMSLRKRFKKFEPCSSNCKSWSLQMNKGLKDDIFCWSVEAYRKDHSRTGHWPQQGLCVDVQEMHGYCRYTDGSIDRYTASTSPSDTLRFSPLRSSCACHKRTATSAIPPQLAVLGAEVGEIHSMGCPIGRHQLQTLWLRLLIKWGIQKMLYI